MRTAGTVFVSADAAKHTLAVVRAEPAAGWSATIVTATGKEILVRFDRNGSTATWKATFEDDGIHHEVEVETEDGSGEDD